MKRTLVFLACLVVLSGQTVSAQDPAPTGSPTVEVPGSPPDVDPDRPTTVAVQTQEVPSPAAPDHYSDQALWALLVAQLYEYLKRTKWFSWVTPQSTSRMKTQFGFLLAVITAAGINFAVSGNLYEGASITISGLSLNAFKDVAWQWGAQQAWYKLVVKEPREVAVTAKPHESV